MPIQYDIIESKKIIMAVGSGIVTAQEIICHLDELAEDKRYKSPMKKLVDYRTIEDIKISQEEAKEIAKTKERLKEVFEGEKCAFVAPRNSTYGTSRAHQMLVDPRNIRTMAFKRYEEAIQWLNITIENGVSFPVK